jgi:hypothetical protein
MDFSKVVPSANGTSAEGIDAFDAAEAAPEFALVPPGIYSARVVRGEYYSTKKGDDAYRMRFEIAEGPQAGKTVVRVWTFSAKALSYSKRDLALFGLTKAAQPFSPFPEPGAEYYVRLVVAIQRGDDGIERNDIKRIDNIRIEEAPDARFTLPPEDEGGPTA